MGAGCAARFPGRMGIKAFEKRGEQELIGLIRNIGDSAQITFSAFVNFVNSANLSFKGDLLLYICNPPIHYKFLLYPI